MNNTRQVSGGHPSGQGDILTGLVKRTYSISNNGTCNLSPIQSSLNEELQFYEHCDDLLKADFDLYPTKQFTDVIIKGAIQFKNKQTQTIAKISIGKFNTSILGVGHRKAYLNSGGHLTFSKPSFIPEVPLRYDYAYGGNDIDAFKSFIESIAPDLKKQFPSEINWALANPFRYPRNPLGKGYRVFFDKKTFQEVELPNLEDLTDKLSPSRFFANHAGHWYKMPIPRATDWIHHEFFPRINYLGLQHYFEGDTSQAEELKRSWVHPDVFDGPSDIPNFSLSARVTNGASLGLQLPFLKPGIKVNLKNIHSQFSDFTIQVPVEKPSICVDGRNGKLVKTKPQIYTIEINMFDMTLSIIWGGYIRAIRPYHEEELAKMPFEISW